MDFCNTHNVCLFSYVCSTTLDSNFCEGPLVIFCSEKLNVLIWFLNMQTILLLEVKFSLYVSTTCKTQGNQR